MSKVIKRIHDPVFDDVREFLPEVISAMHESNENYMHFQILVALKRSNQKGRSEVISHLEKSLR